MNKDMLNYFKGEKEFYEFALTQLSGSARMELLGISRAHFTIKKLAKEWYENIRSKITDKKAIEKLEDLYSDMN